MNSVNSVRAFELLFFQISCTFFINYSNKRNVVNWIRIYYRCFNKLWTFRTDVFDTLKNINDLNNFHSVHKIRNCDIGSTSSRTITRWKINCWYVTCKYDFLNITFINNYLQTTTTGPFFSVALWDSSTSDKILTISSTFSGTPWSGQDM